MIFGVTFVEAFENPSLHIAGTSDKLELIMPAEAKNAISKVAPGFIPWRAKDYLPRVLENFQDSKPNSAPFAVISDINHDRINDLVVDGFTRDTALTLAVISSGKTYKVHIIEKTPRTNPIVIKDMDEKGIITSGLNRYLRFDEKSKSRDASYAFEIIYIQIQSPGGGLSDPAVIIYSFKNGKFISESLEM